MKGRVLRRDLAVEPELAQAQEIVTTRALGSNLEQLPQTAEVVRIGVGEPDVTQVARVDGARERRQRRRSTPASTNTGSRARIRNALAASWPSPGTGSSVENRSTSGAATVCRMFPIVSMKKTSP